MRGAIFTKIQFLSPKVQCDYTNNKSLESIYSNSMFFFSSLVVPDPNPWFGETQRKKNVQTEKQLVTYSFHNIIILHNYYLITFLSKQIIKWYCLTSFLLPLKKINLTCVYQKTEAVLLHVSSSKLILMVNAHSYKCKCKNFLPSNINSKYFIIQFCYSVLICGTLCPTHMFTFSHLKLIHLCSFSLHKLIVCSVGRC